MLQSLQSCKVCLLAGRCQKMHDSAWRLVNTEISEMSPTWNNAPKKGGGVIQANFGFYKFFWRILEVYLSLMSNVMCTY